MKRRFYPRRKRKFTAEAKGKFRKKNNHDKFLSEYRDKYHEDLVKEIFKCRRWLHTKEGLFGIKTTETSYVLEKDGWDIIISINKTPDKNLKKIIKNTNWQNPLVCIEYKSGVGEWHKSIGAFIRQVNKRKTQYPKFIVSLDNLSFLIFEITTFVFLFR